MLMRQAYRRGNDLIAATASRALERPADFICECSDDDCREPVPLTAPEYDAARRHDGALITPGHGQPGETVIHATDRYEILRNS
jgi:hypothetical protein